MTIRKKLRDELNARFVPLILKHGFCGPERLAGNATLHYYRKPVGATVQVVSIQFDKRQRPRVTVNFHEEPPEGISILTARSPFTLSQGRLTPRPGGFTRSWFRADPPFWLRLLGVRSTTEKKAVTELLDLFGEVEEWFKTKSVGPHLSVWSHTYRPTSRERGTITTS